MTTVRMYNLLLSHRLSREASQLALLREKGFDYFQIFCAPAAGPKYFCNAGFERAFLRTTLTSKKYFVAASAGALRFVTMLCSKYTGRDMNSEFERHLCEFSIAVEDPPELVAKHLAVLFEGYTRPLVDQLLNDRQHALCVFVSQLRPWVARSSRALQYGAFGLGLVANYATPATQRILYRRLCFHTGDAPDASVFQARPHELALHPLTHDNFHAVLRATAAIPFRVAPPDRIAGLAPGVYVDGGLGDYMVNTERLAAPALLLSHTARVHATWMDSLVPYRSPPDALLDQLSVLYPAAAFVRALPDQRLPSRRDWDRYRTRPSERIAKWQACIDLSLRHFPRSLVDEAELQARAPPPSLPIARRVNDSLAAHIRQLRVGAAAALALAEAAGAAAARTLALGGRAGQRRGADPAAGAERPALERLGDEWRERRPAREAALAAASVLPRDAAAAEEEGGFEAGEYVSAQAELVRLSDRYQQLAERMADADGAAPVPADAASDGRPAAAGSGATTAPPAAP